LLKVQMVIILLPPPVHLSNNLFIIQVYNILYYRLQKFTAHF
jgi:hypothetical protein